MAAAEVHDVVQPLATRHGVIALEASLVLAPRRYLAVLRRFAVQHNTTSSGCSTTSFTSAA